MAIMWRMRTGLVGIVPQPVLFAMNLMTSCVLGQHLLQQCCLRVQVMAVWCSHYKRAFKGTALNVMVWINITHWQCLKPHGNCQCLRHTESENSPETDVPSTDSDTTAIAVSNSTSTAGGSSSAAGGSSSAAGGSSSAAGSSSSDREIAAEVEVSAQGN